MAKRSLLKDVPHPSLAESCARERERVVSCRKVEVLGLAAFRVLATLLSESHDVLRVPDVLGIVHGKLARAIAQSGNESMAVRAIY